MTHSKGPWNVYKFKDNLQIDNSDHDICIMNMSSNIQYKHDAQLISAAPDLLSRCKEMDALLASRFWHTQKSSIAWDEFRRELQATIKKAEV